MYCRMCGKKIGDTDHFCQFCGASTGLAEPSVKSSEIKEEIIFNPPYEDKFPKKEEEELKEFISEEEMEEAQQQEAKQEEAQKNEEADTPESVKNPEFAWNIYEFPTEKKQTEAVEFNWNMEDYGQPEPKTPEAAAFEEELFQEIRDDSNRIKEQNIDRFFTFSRKNEEFQELLDKEYEKFQMRSAPIKETAEEPLTIEAAEVQPIEEAAEEPPVIETIDEPPAIETIDEPPVKVIRESGIPEAVPLQEIHIEAEATAEEPEIPEEAQYEEPILVTEAPTLDTETPEEEDVQAPETNEPEAPPRSEQVSEMAKARALYFGEDLIRDNESIRQKLTSGEPEKEDYIDTPAAPAELEAPAAPAELEAPAELAAPDEPEEEADRAVPPSGDLAAAIGEEGDGEEPEHRKLSAGQVVLAVIAIILAVEIAILGIRYFAPESGAAKAIGNVQTEIFNTVAGWIDGDGGQKSENADDQEALPEDNEKADQESVDQEPTTDIEKEPAADPNPMADKNALVASQMGNNKNIELVKANAALAWKQGQNYGLSDINNSKPITNNIWQAPETGDPVYYDKSVVGTVIAFDSQWIDYVNSGDKSVLSLLKKDSEAYLKSVNYTKVGKIKETFKLLEIGEIRQGANGFYIWVHEEISATENGKASDMKYNWIYYLEPVDGQMKIVNYYHF